MSTFVSPTVSIQDSIIKAILEGFIVKMNDTEICDLSYYVKSYGNKPKIQVYRNKYRGKEYCQIFYNYQDAVAKFLELCKEK